MAGLLKACIDQYTSGVMTEAVALRAALGSSGHMYADWLPENVQIPYVSIMEIGTSLESEGKDGSYRIESVSLSFDVYAIGRASVETITECLDNLYMRYLLTVDNRGHLRTQFKNRHCLQEAAGLYHSILELDFILEKIPQ